MQFYDKCWWVVKKPSEIEYKKRQQKKFANLFWRNILNFIFENSYSLIFRKSLLISISPKYLTDYSTQQCCHVEFPFKFFAEKEINRKLITCTMFMWKLKDIKARMFHQKVFQHIVGTCTWLFRKEVAEKQ